MQENLGSPGSHRHAGAKAARHVWRPDAEARGAHTAYNQAVSGATNQTMPRKKKRKKEKKRPIELRDSE